MGDIVRYKCGYIVYPEHRQTVVKYTSASGRPSASLDIVGELAQGWVAYPNDVESVELGLSVTKIGANAFRDFPNLVDVRISSRVTGISDTAFVNCPKLMNFHVDEFNQNFKEANRLLLTYDGKTVVFGVNGQVEVPDGVQTIGRDSFRGYSGLESVSLPSTLKTISNEAFYNCVNLSEIEFPSGLTMISYASFQGSGLRTVNWPSQITSITGRVFRDCRSLGSIHIPDTVTTISTEFLYGCSSLVSVTIPDSVISIANSIFRGCTNLRTVTFGSGLQSLSPTAFTDCRSLTNVTFVGKTLEQVQGMSNYPWGISDPSIINVA